MTKPTIEFYGYLSSAFDFFNKSIFNNDLSTVVFTVTRKKNSAGYFRKAGWTNESDEELHEIAVNPSCFITKSPLELYQTIVHEMCHQWQFEFGEPSRGGYHNKQWAKKMMDIGLRPISANGKGTGQNVSDEPIPGGLFETACIEFFLLGHKLTLVDRRHNNAASLKMLNEVLNERIKSRNVDPGSDHELLIGSDNLQSIVSSPMDEIYEINIPPIIEEKPYSKKATYQCSKCLAKVWGSPKLSIACLNCNQKMNIVN